MNGRLDDRPSEKTAAEAAIEESNGAIPADISGNYLTVQTLRTNSIEVPLKLLCGNIKVKIRFLKIQIYVENF